MIKYPFLLPFCFFCLERKISPRSLLLLCVHVCDCYISCTGFTCQNCQRSFSSTTAIAQHFKIKSDCHAVWLSHVPPTILHRHRPTIDQKCVVLDELVKLEAKHVPLAQSVVRCVHPLYSKKNISEWSSDRVKLFLARSFGYGNQRALVSFSKVRWEVQEDEVYMHFVIRRELEGLNTDDQWVKDKMDEMLVRDKPSGWENFCASNGWVTGFKKRYRITHQCQTNKKHLNLQEKLPLVKMFHSWLIYTLQRSAPQRCPKYGRFPGRAMFHMDQVFFFVLFFDVLRLDIRFYY